MNNKSVIIVAGGKGLRMGGDIPKQFLVVDGAPILMHTIQRFHDYDHDMAIIVVLPQPQQDYWQQLCEKYAFGIPHIVADGGKERFDSVKNGLELVPADCDVVGVHDGVRPYVSQDTIDRCYKTAAETGTAIPVIDIVETVRHLSPDGKTSCTVPRSEYKLVQTPQVFKTEILRKAYQQEFTPAFTDDASVVEALGYTSITLVQGNRENIKITTPSDLRN